MVSFRGQKSLSHTQIGLLLGLIPLYWQASPTFSYGSSPLRTKGNGSSCYFLQHCWKSNYLTSHFLSVTAVRGFWPNCFHFQHFQFRCIALVCCSFSMVHIFDRIIVIGVTSSLNTSTTLANLFLMFRFRVAACRRITKEEMKLLVYARAVGMCWYASKPLSCLSIWS